MGRRGYAIAFLVVLVFGCAAAFLAGRFFWQSLQGALSPAPAWVPPDQRTEQPAATSFAVAPSTAAVERPATPLPADAPPDLSGVVLTPFASPTPTLAGALADLPTDMPTPGATDTPTPAATQFVPAGPVRYSSGDCPGNYVLGSVSDGNGSGLADVRLRLNDEYGNGEFKTTKAGGEVGRYDFPVYGPPRRFYLAVVDAGGKPLSPEIEIDHGLGANAKATCYWVNWRRP